jgi:hypothetical protein
MMLQASIVERKVDQPTRAEVAEIRRLGYQAAARLALVQQFRDRSRKARRRVDLCQLVHEVPAADPELARGVVPAAGGGPLMVVANPDALKRLVQLLIAIVRLTTDGALRLHALGRDAQARLELEPAAAGPEAVAVWQQLADDGDEPIPVMERLAALALARLVGASLHVRMDPAGGLSLAAEWPVDGGDSVDVG